MKSVHLYNEFSLLFKGCCIYEKPKEFGESSSEESDDECEHCHGHKDSHSQNKSGGSEATQENGIQSQPGKKKTFIIIKILFYYKYYIILSSNSSSVRLT